MKKLTKKRNCLPLFLLFVIIFLSISVFFFFLSEYNFKAKESNIFSPYEYEPFVIIDAGHGGEDGGAVGKNGALEKNINLELAKKLYTKLSEMNIKCVLTRETDILLYDRNQNYEGRKKMLDMQARKRIVESYENAVFISIHQNSFPDGRYSGFQAYYSTNSPNSRVLSTLIENNVRINIQPNNKRTSKASSGNIYLLDNLHCPAVLLECGFLSNKEECELLCSEEYQERLADVFSFSVAEFIKTSRV